MKKITIYRPRDTCECVLAYEWDDEVPDAERVHTPCAFTRNGVVEAPKLCPLHSDITDVKEHHDLVVGENQFKNQRVNEIAEALGVNPDTVPFSFDGRGRERKLKIITSNFSTQQKADIAKVLSKHEKSKVDVA